ncbi:ATP-grasp fold amidoligase family protein [Psychrobacter sp. A3]|uniref:ATP-grasp fold amidoligase family protein n=1 Tax=Psychrobacter sp. A3 TaxID=2992754 RepID=UPI00237BAF0A|nr:ATP-grasp fold amidoligase family protein [Psychrobacter sp. A3]MDE0490140.1 ATP-grasp fold amidoligase family protein [Psychrobacter sp. A3]
MTNEVTPPKLLMNALSQLDINIKQFGAIQEHISLTLDRVALLYGRDSQEYTESLKKVYKIIPLKEIRQSYITPYMSLPATYSHVAKQVEYMRFKQHLSAIDYHISPWNNNKKIDQEFAKSLDIPTVELLQSECKFDDIEFSDYIVIKPSFGSSSRNVFLYFNSESIVEVKTNQTFTSLEAFKAEIARRQIQGLWQTETLILNNNGKAAHDIKVYAYYGKIGAVLEIKRTDKAYQCWYNAEGEILESERRSQPWFEGTGFESQVIEYAKKISLNIPAPFMRIDFYKGANGYYLGELTPHPGRYFPEYSPELDKQLGKFFCEAEARLFRDLLDQKHFDRYSEFYNRK